MGSSACSIRCFCRSAMARTSSRGVRNEHALHAAISLVAEQVVRLESIGEGEAMGDEFHRDDETFATIIEQMRRVSPLDAQAQTQRDPLDMRFSDLIVVSVMTLHTTV